MNVLTQDETIALTPESKKVTISTVLIESPDPNNFLQIQSISRLESATWAPWLSYSLNDIRSIINIFPEGQFIIKDPNNKDTVIGFHSTNRVKWNGRISDLKSWDELAGVPPNYNSTYLDDGNALTLMSMSIHPFYTGQGLSGEIVSKLFPLADKLGVEYIIGPFRPSGYPYNKNIDFESYCRLRRGKDNMPVDPWLRSVYRMGMIPLKVQQNAMQVVLNIDEFESLMKNTALQFNWQVNKAGTVWECEQVGCWYLSGDKFVYKENNLWGAFPYKTIELLSRKINAGDEVILKAQDGGSYTIKAFDGVTAHAVDLLSNRQVLISRDAINNMVCLTV